MFSEGIMTCELSVAVLTRDVHGTLAPPLSLYYLTLPRNVDVGRHMLSHCLAKRPERSTFVQRYQLRKWYMRSTLESGTSDQLYEVVQYNL